MAACTTMRRPGWSGLDRNSNWVSTSGRGPLAPKVAAEMRQREHPRGWPFEKPTAGLSLGARVPSSPPNRARLERLRVGIGGERVVYSPPKPRRLGQTALSLAPPATPRPTGSLGHRHRYREVLAPPTPLRAAGTARGSPPWGGGTRP